jgi:sulfatase modifying factor 1
MNKGDRLKYRYLPLVIFAIFFCPCTGKKETGQALKTMKPLPAEMLMIPGGEFVMGSDSSDESPRHKVLVDTFYMDKCEVTNQQYGEFVKATGHPRPLFCRDTSLNKPQQPVVGVSYYDALSYAKWAGKRLPTEAEWEYAARGGLPGKEFPWGDGSPFGRCNYFPEGGKGSDGFAFTARVGAFPANPYGLFDMAGNAWEWCSDFYDSAYYAVSPSVNPSGPDSGYTRVLRGGSWLSMNTRHLRCSSRLELKPYIQDRYYGFRCVKDRY